MNTLTTILTLLTGINASFELGRNVRSSQEAHRKRVFERAGRMRIRAAARKLERLGGHRARVRPGLDDDRDPALIVERWGSVADIPAMYLQYPVLDVSQNRR